MFSPPSQPTDDNRLPKAPLSHRLPLVIEKEVVRYMTILDRSTLRLSSNAARELADQFPYHINTLYIFCNSKELNVTIHEARGRSIVFDPETPEKRLLTVLSNPNLQIRKLCIFTRRGITGDRIHQFVEKLKAGGVQRSSLNIQQVKIGYDIFIKCDTPTRRGRTEAGVREMMELCVPGVLSTITYDVDFIDLSWTSVVETPQWKRAVNIRVIGK